MNRHAVFHQTNSEYCFPMPGDSLVVRLRTARGDCDAVTIHWHDKYRFNRGDRTHRAVMMTRFARTELFDFWEGVIDPVGNGARYFFELAPGIYFGAQGFYDTFATIVPQFFWYSYVRPQDIFTVPSWAADAVVYQVFPDRFHPGTDALPDDWHEPVEWNTFRGGNLQGIIRRLDHIRELGINCLYLTPVFQSPSNHKYDIVDYYRIDPAFGTEADLVELVNRAHGMGIRVVLDAVFNHTSTEFAPFRDVCEKGAASEYVSWFSVKKYPVVVKDFPDYETFGYYGHMPKLMTDNPAAREYLIGAAEYWTRTANIDGWRIDVADEIEHEFWREFRRRLKAINPELLIVGELWGDARAWLHGDQYDTVMNYPFMNMLRGLFAGGGAELFFRSLGEVRARYRHAPWSVLWNIIGSHDTPRFRTTAGGSTDALRIAALLQMTTPGAPFIYYGDELAMEGGHDPECRLGMAWERGDEDTYCYYRAVIAARHRYACLRRGEMERIAAPEHIIAYRMVLADEDAVVVINIGAEPYVYTVDMPRREVISDQLIAGTVCVVPMSGILLVRR